jgi:hypothetical protein
VNLANLRLLASDSEGALAVVKQGLEKNRESALLNLLATRISAEQGTAASATQRAAKSGEAGSLIWDAGE